MFNYKFVVKGIVTYSGGPLQEINNLLSEFGLPGHKISLKNKEPIQIMTISTESEKELPDKEIEKLKNHIRKVVKDNLKFKHMKVESLEVTLCQ